MSHLVLWGEDKFPKVLIAFAFLTESGKVPKDLKGAKLIRKEMTLLFYLCELWFKQMESSMF